MLIEQLCESIKSSKIRRKGWCIKSVDLAFEVVCVSSMFVIKSFNIHPNYIVMDLLILRETYRFTI